MPTPRETAGELLRLLSACLAEGTGTSGPLAALARAIEGVEARAVPAIDGALRAGEFVREDGWYSLNARTLARFQCEEAWPVLVLAASHHSGWVRQAALEGLARWGDGRVVPCLLLRLNDWVQEIRGAAHAALGRFLEPAFAATLVSALPLVLALDSQRRGLHQTTTTTILGLLRSPACIDLLTAGCRSGARAERHLCFRLASQSAAADPFALLEQAMRDTEPSIRVWAVQQAAGALDQPWPRDQIVRRRST